MDLDLFDQFSNELQGQIKNNFVNNPLTTQAAIEVQKLAGVTDQRILADQQERKRLLDAQEANGIPYADLQQYSPSLLTWMIDTKLSPIIKDDWREMSFLERRLNNVGDLARAIKAGGQGVLGSAAWANEQIGIIGTVVLGNIGLEQLAYDEVKNVEYFKQQKEYWFNSMKEELAIATKNYGVVGRGFYSAVSSLTTQAPGLVTSIATKNPWAMAGWAAFMTFTQSETEALQAGLSKGDAAIYAGTQAILEGGFEYLGGKVFLKDLVNNTGFLKMVAKNMAVEVGTELATTATQNLNTELTMPNGSFESYLAKLPADLQETVAATVWQSLLMTGGVKSYQLVFDRQVDIANKISQQEHLEQGLMQIADAAEKTKLNARDKDLLQSFVQQSSVMGDVQSLYVPMPILKSLTPEQIALLPDSVHQKIIESSDVNAPLQMSVSEFLAADPSLHQLLANNALVEPNGMTLNELEEAAKNNIEEIKQTVDRQLNQKPYVYSKVKESLTGTIDNQSAGYLAMAYDQLYTNLAEQAGMTAQDLYDQAPINFKKMEGGESRGAYDFENRLIKIYANSDPSTVLHESAHFFLDLYTSVAQNKNVNKVILDDAQELMKYLGYDSVDAFVNDQSDARVKAHEKMAESFEIYLAEGKSPVARLQNAFRAFRKWMVGTYQYLTGSADGNVKDVYGFDVPPNISAIFNRMFYIDDKIKQGETEAGLNQQIDPNLLTPEERAIIAQKDIEASDAAIEQLSAQTEADMLAADPSQTFAYSRVDAPISVVKNVGDLGRKLKQLKEGRIKTKKDAEEIVSKLPVVMAYDAIKNGLLNGQQVSSQGMLLDAKEVRAIAKLLKLDFGKLRKFTTTSEGMSIDDFNTITGIYNNSNDLLIELSTFDGKKEAIDRTTKQLMLDRYGKLQDSGLMKKEINLAITAEKRLDSLYAQLDLVRNRIQVIKGGIKGLTKEVRALSLRQIKTAASDYVRLTKLKDLVPEKFLRASKDNSMDFLKAFKKGDYTTAFDSKKNQIIATAITHEMGVTQKSLEKILKYFEKVRNIKNSKVVGADYHAAILAALDKYDFSGKGEVDNTAFRKFVANQLKNGRLPDYAIGLLSDKQRQIYELQISQRDENGMLIHQGQDKQIEVMLSLIEQKPKVPIQEVSVEEIEGLHAVIKHIEFLGKNRDQMLNGKKFSDVELELVDSIRSYTGKRPKKIKYERSQNKDRAARSFDFFLSEAINAGAEINVIDNGKDQGAAYQNLLKPLVDANVEKVQLSIELAEKIHKILSPLYAKNSAAEKVGKGIFIDSLGMSMNWKARMAVLLNTGNESNYSRLLNGGINGNIIEPNQINDVLETLSKDDLLAAQKIWDVMAEMTPKMVKVYKDINGVAPDLITPRPITIKTNNGETVTLQGGYYPVIYDSWKSSQVQDVADLSAAQQSVAMAAAQATVHQGFTKSRVDMVIGKELVLDLDGIFTGLNHVVHYVTFMRPSLDVAKLLRSKKITEAIEQTHGASSLKTIKDYFKDTVSANMEVTTSTEKIASMLRQNIALSRMAFNITSSAVNLTGFMQAAGKVGMNNLLRSAVTLMTKPNHLRDIRSSVNMMQIRDQTRTREISEVATSLRQVTRFKELATRYGYFLMQKTGAVTDAIVWNASFEKNVATMGVDKAKEQASLDVYQTQSGALDFNLSKFQREKGWSQLFSVLYGYMNSQFNQLYRSYKVKNSPDFAMDIIKVSIIPTVLVTILRAALTGDELEPDKLAKKSGADVAGNALGLLPFVRELSFVPSSILGGYGDYNGPSGLGLIYDSGKMAKQIYSSAAKGFNGENPFDKALIKSMITVAGDLTGIPSAQLNKSIDASSKLLDNNNNGALDYARLILGNKTK